MMDFTLATFLNQDFESMNLVEVDSSNQPQHIDELNTFETISVSDPIINQLNNNYDEYQNIFQNDNSMYNSNSTGWRPIASSYNQSISSQNSQIDASLPGIFGNS
jgi:hypothetical protein